MIDLRKTFDVIVVGGGHAGTEAAPASHAPGAKHTAESQHRNTGSDVVTRR